MFINQFPNFKKGTILKQDMLENLRDYPRGFFEMNYKEYSDGIIAGSDISIDGDYIFIEQGLIRFAGRTYILKEREKINYSKGNKEMFIKVKFLDESEDKSFRISQGEIFLSQEMEIGEGELELGRFKLREGAELRANYQGYSDFSTEYNTVNIIDVNYAHPYESTFHPRVINIFAKELLRKKQVEQLDLFFAMQALNSSLLSRAFIRSYLQRKFDLDYIELTNRDIYNYLHRVLKSSGSANPQVKKGRVGPNKIIVD